MTATPEALWTAVEQDPLASPDPRRGLIFVGVFIALCLVLAGIAFLPAMPTDVAPFVLALGPLVVALGLALVEGNGAITRLTRTLTVIPQNRLWFLVIVLPVVWAVTVLIVAIVAGAPAAGLFDGVVIEEPGRPAGRPDPRLRRGAGLARVRRALAVAIHVTGRRSARTRRSVDDHAPAAGPRPRLDQRGLGDDPDGAGAVRLLDHPHLDLRRQRRQRAPDGNRPRGPERRGTDLPEPRRREAWLWRGIVAAVIAVLVVLYGRHRSAASHPPPPLTRLSTCSSSISVSCRGAIALAPPSLNLPSSSHFTLRPIPRIAAHRATRSAPA